VVLSSSSFWDRELSGYRKPFDILLKRPPEPVPPLNGREAEIAKSAAWQPCCTQTAMSIDKHFSFMSDP
jgi:hypothetical protein